MIEEDGWDEEHDEEWDDRSEETSDSSEWQHLLKREIDEVLAKQKRNAAERIALIEKQRQARSALYDLLGDYFDQICDESLVTVGYGQGPPILYTVRVNGDGDWMECIEVYEEDGGEGWRLESSSAQGVNKLSLLREHLETLTKKLAERLVLARAKHQRHVQQEQEMALAREKEAEYQRLLRQAEAAKKRESEEALKDEEWRAETRKRESRLEHEARMKARR